MHAPSRRYRVYAVVLLLTLSGQPVVNGGIPGIPGASPFATEATQLINLAQLTAALAKDVIIADASLGMLDDMATQGTLLDPADIPATTVSADILSLVNVLTQANGVAFALSQSDEDFRAKYPAYDPAGGTYYDAYASWYGGTMDTILGTLKRAGINTTQVLAADGVAILLRGMLATPAGRNVALQLGNVIGMEIWGAINRLNVLFAAQMQSYAAYTGYMLNKDLAQQSATATALSQNTQDHDELGCGQFDQSGCRGLGPLWKH